MIDDYYRGEPLRIGNETQLLVDDNVVEDRWKLERVLHHPLKCHVDPVIQRDRPWEGETLYAANVLWDDACGRYRMWYGNYSHGALESGEPWLYYIAYAESDDGLSWEKPLLDVCPYPGHAKTNIVYTGTHMQGTRDVPRHRIQLGDVVIDRSAPDPQRRYKMIALQGRVHSESGGVLSGINLACSPDGIHWSLTGDRAILDYHSDCENHLVRDEANDRWLLYCRPTMYSSGRSGRGRHHRRRVSVMTSPDLIEWSYPRMAFYPDEFDCPDFDHTRAFRYGNTFLMMYAAMEGDTTGRNEIRLASSSDGLHWQPYATREAFIPRGEPGAWDMGSVRPTCRPVSCPDGLLIYYSGASVGQHEEGTRLTGIGATLLRRDGFVEQRAGEETGYLLTKEFVLEGNRLEVNMASVKTGTYPNRGMRVEIVRHAPMGEHWKWSEACEGFGLDDCDPLTGRGEKQIVSWRGESDLSALKGQAVYVRFELRQAGLFSFRVGK